VTRLRAAGWESYLVGGVVRDILLGRTPTDLDVATAAPADVVAGTFPETIPVGAAFGVTVVVIGGSPFQVATFRQEESYRDGRRPSVVGPAGAEVDAQRRDFTINALLYDPATDTVIDHVGGRLDLSGRVIRTVGDPAVRFAEDHLRMLRAARFAAELGFTIEPATEAAMTALAPVASGLSAERVREELVRLLVAPGRAEGLRILARTGLLEALLPEVASLEGSRPGDEPRGRDRFALTLRALERLRHPTAVAAAASLFLHVGAPEQVDALCRRLRFSGADRRAIVALVRERVRVAELPLMRIGEVRGLLRRVAGADLLEVYRASASALGEDPGTYARAAEIIAACAGARDVSPLLTGDDLIRLGFQPGPEFARILDAVDTARTRHEISTRAEARAFVLARFAAGAFPHAAEASPEPESSRNDGG
jgi:poly(A) polymerase